MKPEVIKKYVDNPDAFSILRNETAWENRSSPRDECFMASEGAPTVYSYGNANKFRNANHTYSAIPMIPLVEDIMKSLNEDFKAEYNVCVLNYYLDEKGHLGWHADDSPEQDLSHPIAVISFGATRFFWWKKKEMKGDIPDENKILMEPGDLVIMPGGFQDDHYHRIPKHSEKCDGRISLTFRKLVRYPGD